MADESVPSQGWKSPDNQIQLGKKRQIKTFSLAHAEL